MRSLLLALLLGCTSFVATAQTIEDSTCFTYFKITDKLRRGDSLDRATWYNFLQNKAIQVYMNDQGADSSYYEYYRRTMQIVYMPQKDSILRRQLKDSMTYWFTYLIYQYKKNEVGMKNYLRWLNTHPKAYFDSCYKYCYTALPQSAQKTAPQEKFSIIPLHNDAHAENGWVVYSLLCAYFNDRNKLGVLGGHELHHVLRPQLDVDPDKKDLGVLVLLARTLNEGSADLVDKKYMTAQATALLPYQRGTFEDFFDQGRRQMPRIDSLLQLAATKDSSYTLYNYLKGAETTSGHVPGTYMTAVIERNNLKAALLDHIDNFFALFLIYDEAAKKDKDSAYRLSPTSIDYIKRLQRKYQAKTKG